MMDLGYELCLVDLI